MAISHKRDANARRKPKAALVAGPIALLATASVVGLGVVANNPETRDVVASQGASADFSHTRDAVVSRSQSRADAHVDGKRLQRAYDVNMSRTATLRAVRDAHTKLWTTTLLNLWPTPGEDGKRIGSVEAAKQVLVTGRKAAGRDEIVLDGQARWVTSGYLAADKPVAETAGAGAAGTASGVTSSPCPDSSTESGLTSNAVLVYRSVCHAFPQITTYGGYDAHGEHASGRALDIMTSDVSLGTAIADFLQAHSSELHLYDIIWRQHIWTPERSSEGWRYMASRGSTTANHYDHVHVSTY